MFSIREAHAQLFLASVYFIVATASNLRQAFLLFDRNIATAKSTGAFKRQCARTLYCLKNQRAPRSSLYTPVVLCCVKSTTVIILSIDSAPPTLLDIVSLRSLIPLLCGALACEPGGC